ncbi:MAG: tetratricopeptide repeat protein [Thermoanaerobaculia bacterium]|nr:tetratricopeptide repeat protein [Thermoanaerobaculia bacterium]
MAVQRDKVIASAEKLVAKGKIEPAIKEYERLLDDNPNDVNTLNRIGDLWVRINRTDEAVKTFGRIADHYSKDGFFLKAIAIYKKINKLDPSKLEVYAKLADLYAKQGLAMEAKSQYQVLADYYIKHGDPANALNIYRKISELDPNSINVHVKLADLHSQVGQTAEALKEYDRVGRMLLKRGMLEEAVQVFRKALKIDGKNVDLVESLITALLEAKDYANAKTIVEQALETNRDHPRLLAMWAKILIAKGDIASARTALEKGLAKDPTEPLIRETLADLYLKQSDANRALEMIIPLTERALSKGDRGAAVEMLQRVLRVDQGHTPTLERLVALYTRLNEETNILSSMNSLAEAHIASGEYEKSAAVLDKLILREPQNAQHRTKLQFVRSNMPGGAPGPTPIRRKTGEIPIPTMPPMEIEEPEPTFDMSGSESGGGITLEPAGTKGRLDLDFSMDSPHTPQLVPAVELAAMELDAEGGDDLDFITEHLTEAEVFAKYGLAEKAAEHLRAVLERAPKHPAAHDRLFRILLDEGDVEGARAAATQYLAILEEKGETSAIDAVHSEFLSHGHSLTTTRPAAKKAAPKGAPMPASVEELEPAVEEIELLSLSADLTEADDEISFDLDAPAEVEPEIAAEVEESGISIELEPEVELTAEPEAEVVSEFQPQFAPELTSAPAADEPFFGVEALHETPIEEPAVEEPVIEEPSPEEVGEIDFYIEQELFDEARARLDSLLARFPDNLDLQFRGKRIDNAIKTAAALAAAPPPAPKPLPPPKLAPAPKPAPTPKAAPPPPPPKAVEPPRPATISRDEIESEILSAIPDDDDVADVIPAPAAAPAALAPEPPVFAATPVQEENLFADENDFFDLAAELESELDDSDDVISLSEEEQSLEEIFKEFKKGVEQQLDSEDYDTHYNLGIAYKEMGLIDEAIGEFQLASKDPKRAVECASMLGLCFLEKGMPQLAIKWYRKGLEMPEIIEDEHIGLLYDLGSAYIEVGDTENAQKAFMEVYSLNSNYREIISKMKQLEDARK